MSFKSAPGQTEDKVSRETYQLLSTLLTHSTYHIPYFVFFLAASVYVQYSLFIYFYVFLLSLLLAFLQVCSARILLDSSARSSGPQGVPILSAMGGQIPQSPPTPHKLTKESLVGSIQ